jgi:hypothetical protein
MPQFAPLDQFLIAFSYLVSELNKLLGVKFVPGRTGGGIVLYDRLGAVLRYNNEGKFRERDVLLQALALLAKELAEIEAADPKVLAKFRKAILRAGRDDTFFGLRHEVNVAAALARNRIPFAKEEAPDFRIPDCDGDVAIECTSARIRGSSPPGDLYYKITAKVAEKDRKSYATLSTALCVDITNLAYTSVSNATAFLHLVDRNEINKLASSHAFGAVILDIYQWNDDNNRFEADYLRADRDDISFDLHEVLDVCFPYGSHPVPRFSIPAEG